MQDQAQTPPPFHQRHRLSLRLIGRVMLASGALTLMAIAFQLYVEFERDISFIESQLDDVEAGYVTPLSESLWMMDRHLVQLHLDGIRNVPDIAGAILYTQDMGEFTVGDIEAGGRVAHRELPLALAVEQRNYDLGTLHVAADLDAAYQRTWDRLMTIVFTQAFKVFAISAALFSIFYYLVTRHLTALAGFARRAKFATLDTPVTLVRPSKPGGQTDELDDLVSGLNEMQRNLLTELDAREEATAQYQRLSDAVSRFPVGLIIADPNGQIEFINEHASQWLPEDDQAAVSAFDHQYALFRCPQQSDEVWATVMRRVREHGQWKGERRVVRNGEMHHEVVTIARLAHGDSYDLVGTIEDITALRESERKLLEQARSDPETQLPNRVLAVDRIEHALLSTQRRSISLLMVQLGGVANLPRSISLQAGRDLLVKAAARLSETVANNDACWAARYAPDQFLLVCEHHQANPTAPEHLANQVLSTFERHFTVDRRKVFLDPSIGIVMAPNDGDETELLLDRATTAMLVAARDAQPSYRFFDEALHAALAEQMDLAAELRLSLQTKDVDLHYQPVFSVQDQQQPHAVEALIRWQSPDRGAVDATMLIELAENYGLIRRIDRLVIQHALSDLPRLRARYGEQLKLAINISPTSLTESGFADAVINAIEASGFQPTDIQLEITEHTMLEGTAAVQENLGRLHGTGVTLLLDDFGTGYATLAVLRSLPFAVVKVDRTFVADLEGEKKAEAHELISALVQLARGLGKAVVAEGVETTRQYELVQELECDFVQGYLLGRPEPL